MSSRLVLFQPSTPEPPGAASSEKSPAETPPSDDGDATSRAAVPATRDVAVAPITVSTRTLDDPLASFDTESGARGTGGVRGRGAPWRVLLVLGGIVAGAGLTLLVARFGGMGGSAAMGSARFESSPSGLAVVVDGTKRGITPLTISLLAGDHQVEIQGARGSRTLPVTVTGGATVSQYVELGGATAPETGRLDVSTSPAGAQVAVDGAARGTSPLVLDALPAGEHTVTLTRGGTLVTRTVQVTAGGTATMFLTLGAAPETPAVGTVGGYVSMRAPFEMQVFEGGRLIGTTSAERLMVPTGRHDFELVSTALQYRTTVSADVRPGADVAISVPLPNGTLSVNAAPWAEVSIDGRSVGTTPLANLSVPIGAHEVVWRHPQLGERRQTVTVTAQTPVRVGVSLAP